MNTIPDKVGEPVQKLGYLYPGYEAVENMVGARVKHTAKEKVVISTWNQIGIGVAFQVREELRELFELSYERLFDT